MLIDANIFLEILLEQKKSEDCKSILREIHKGQRKAIISIFTIDTIILAMTRNKVQLSKVKIFLESLRNIRGLKLYNINFRDRMLALDLMKRYELDYEDAVTLQAAISNNCKEILSFDRHFDKIKEIKRIEP